jgi:hypothetical protein
MAIKPADASALTKDEERLLATLESRIDERLRRCYMGQTECRLEFAPWEFPASSERVRSALRSRYQSAEWEDLQIGEMATHFAVRLIAPGQS